MGKTVYQIVHRPTGQLWSCSKGRTIWPDLNSAVAAYNIDRHPRTPFYSAQTEYVARGTRIGAVK